MMRRFAQLRRPFPTTLADAMKGLALGLVSAVLFGYAPIGVAADSATSQVVFIDGAQAVSAAESNSDLYIIEEDDVTGELIVYIWKDTDNDGAKDQFDVITGVSSDLRQIAAQ